MSGDVDLIVVGGTGRMGRVLVETAAAPCRVAAVVGLDADRPPWLDPAIGLFRTLSEAFGAVPRATVVSVSVAAGEGERIAEVAAAGRALVEGTTGLDDAARRALAEASRRVAVVHAPNFSAGVAVLRALVARVAAIEAPDWRPAVLDRHHRRKLDAPSGTALLLRDALGAKRDDAEVASFRHGGVVGEHSVYFTGESEEIILSHRAFDRRAFAAGALLAARFAAVAPPGLYGMADVLGLGDPEGRSR